MAGCVFRMPGLHRNSSPTFSFCLRLRCVNPLLPSSVCSTKRTVRLSTTSRQTVHLSPWKSCSLPRSICIFLRGPAKLSAGKKHFASKIRPFLEKVHAHRPHFRWPLGYCGCRRRASCSIVFFCPIPVHGVARTSNRPWFLQEMRRGCAIVCAPIKIDQDQVCVALFLGDAASRTRPRLPRSATRAPTRLQSCRRMHCRSYRQTLRSYAILMVNCRGDRRADEQALTTIAVSQRATRRAAVALQMHCTKGTVSCGHDRINLRTCLEHVCFVHVCVLNASAFFV